MLLFNAVHPPPLKLRPYGGIEMNVLLLLLFEVLHRFVLLTETDKKLPIWTSEL